jgi:hypothetical protein
MSDAKADATNRAVFSVQIIALILKGLSDGETPVDPGVVELLGRQLEEAHEAIEGTVHAPRTRGVA